MERYLKSQIKKDLNKMKMVFVGGPRQVGKTTLAKEFCKSDSYFNWDIIHQRDKILKGEFSDGNCWVFDELHKYSQWRQLLKGLYDEFKTEKKILVTGSARLDLYRRGGDSLQGRYHYLRLHPLTIDELNSRSENDLLQLFRLGGFPEPFLGGSKFEAQRWSREYRQRILREDISSIETIEDLDSAELLMIRLPDLVGSPLSINKISLDVGKSPKTIKRWFQIFENFYAVYTLIPFGAPKIKAVKKERKHYHFDWTLIKDEGPAFENMVGNHLLKWTHFYQDTQGRDLELRYFRDQEQREVDFVLLEDRKPVAFVECKLNDTNISPHLKYLKNKFPKTKVFQITLKNPKDFVSENGIRVGPAIKLLFEIHSLISTSIAEPPA
jgi:uncharacterized protein